MKNSNNSKAAWTTLLHEAAYALGLQADGLSRLTISGNESLPSRFPVTDLAVASIGAAGLAVSELLGLVDAPREVVIDRHLASAWFRWSLKPLGWSPPAPWDAIAGDYQTPDGWIKLHTNAPHHRAAALSILDCAGEKAAVVAAVARFSANDLEQAIIAAGGCAAAMRSQVEWQAHAQGKAVSSEPLISLSTQAADRPSAWNPDASRPLAGIKVLDLTRVLAGPVATRFLAGLGADVLRIDPPDWDEPGIVPDVTLGKRCARLDLHKQEDRSTFEALLSQADMLVHGYRLGALDGLGYGPAQRRAINADLIDVSLNAYGWSGPWADRRGFDSLVQMSSGIAEAGMRWQGADRPFPLPVQALDHATGYLMAAAAIRSLIGRTRDGAIFTAKLSLARTASSLVGCGDAESHVPFSGSTDADYGLDLESTAWGPCQRLHPPASIEGIGINWDRPAAELGSEVAGWLP